MSSTALRAVRELRGDSSLDSRPGTSSGVRPGTSSGRPVSAEETTNVSGDIRKELEDVRLALEKEKRNSRALEQYLAEVTEAKDTEIKEALVEAKTAQQSLQRAEQHAESLEKLYKDQVAKLTAVVERWQPKPPSGREAEETFSAVLREEMRSMQQSYQLKLDRAQAELQAKTAEYGKQTRALNEALIDERRKNASMLDKMTRSAAGPTSPTAASAAGRPNSGTSTTPNIPKTTSSSTTTATKPVIKGKK